MKWLLLSAFIFMITETQYKRSPVTDAECYWETYYLKDSVPKKGPYAIRVNYKKDTIISQGWTRYWSKGKLIEQYQRSSDTSIIEGKSIYKLVHGVKYLCFNDSLYKKGHTFYFVDEPNHYSKMIWAECKPIQYSFRIPQEDCYVYKVRKTFISSSITKAEEAEKIFKDTATRTFSEGIEAYHPIFGITAYNTIAYESERIRIFDPLYPEDTLNYDDEFDYNLFMKDNGNCDSIMAVLKKRLNF